MRPAGLGRGLQRDRPRRPHADPRVRQRREHGGARAAAARTRRGPLLALEHDGALGRARERAAAARGARRHRARPARAAGGRAAVVRAGGARCELPDELDLLLVDGPPAHATGHQARRAPGAAAAPEPRLVAGADGRARRHRPPRGTRGPRRLGGEPPTGASRSTSRRRGRRRPRLGVVIRVALVSVDHDQGVDPGQQLAGRACSSGVIRRPRAGRARQSRCGSACVWRVVTIACPRRHTWVVIATRRSRARSPGRRGSRPRHEALSRLPRACD